MGDLLEKLKDVALLERAFQILEGQTIIAMPAAIKTGHERMKLIRAHEEFAIVEFTHRYSFVSVKDSIEAIHPYGSNILYAIDVD